MVLLHRELVKSAKRRLHQKPVRLIAQRVVSSIIFLRNAFARSLKKWMLHALLTVFPGYAYRYFDKFHGFADASKYV